MKKEAIDQLIKPFKPEQLKKRQGCRKELTYVDGAVVVERLNQVFAHDWTWEILDSRIDPAPVAKNGKDQHDVTVRGRLTVRDEDEVIVKEAFGGVRVGPFGAGECRGDDLKGAATDALKKAASLLGIGLDLYTEVMLQGEEDARATSSTRSSSSKASTASKGGAAAKKASGPPRRTGDQAGKIAALLHATGMPDEVFADKVKGKYACAPEAMTVEQAAAVIAWLEGIKARNSKAA